MVDDIHRKWNPKINKSDRWWTILRELVRFGAFQWSVEEISKSISIGLPQAVPSRLYSWVLRSVHWARARINESFLPGRIPERLVNDARECESGEKDVRGRNVRSQRVSKEIHGWRSERRRGRERTAELFLGIRVRRRRIEAGHLWSSIKPHIIQRLSA